jgi:hypothetical protein
MFWRRIKVDVLDLNGHKRFCYGTVMIEEGAIVKY